MKTERLVTMANDIGHFFNAEADKNVAAQGVANHIKRYWDPRMRREMLAYYRSRLEREFPGRYVIFGHIGDAHLHVNVFSSPENPKAATDLILEFARKAVELGGTVSAEHGLGRRKAHLLKLQYAPEHLDIMRAVKRRLDPRNILGRGVLWESGG